MSIVDLKLINKTEQVSSIVFDTELVKERYRNQELIIFLCEDDKRKYFFDKNDYVVAVATDVYIREGHYVIKEDDVYSLCTIQRDNKDIFSLTYNNFFRTKKSAKDFSFIGLIVKIIKDV